MEGGGETEIVSSDGLEFISALIRENVQKKVQMNIPSLTFEPVIQKKKQLPLNLSSRWLPFIWAPLNYSPAKFSWNRLFAPAAVDSLSLFCNQNVLFSYVMIHLSLWWSEGLEEGAWAASFLTGSPCFTCTEPSWVELAPASCHGCAQHWGTTEQCEHLAVVLQNPEAEDAASCSLPSPTASSFPPLFPLQCLCKIFSIWSSLWFLPSLVALCGSSSGFISGGNY